MRPVRRRAARLAVPLAVALLLAGCNGGDGDSQAGRAPSRPAVSDPTSSTGGGPTSSAASATSPDGAPEPSLRATRFTRVARGLDVPWGVAPDGEEKGAQAALVSERDTAKVLRVVAGGSTRLVGTVPGVRPSGEGGLLGLALVQRGQGVPPAPRKRLYAYFTSDEGDNRVVRMDLAGPADAPTLGRPVLLLSGIPSAGIHNGGRLLVGPDGYLYVGTGDGGRSSHAQDRASLGGKILRVDLEGRVPPDNPFGSPVWSYGHRNVQGLAFDAGGRLWATEFGQDTWDELNLIRAGGNYGWPLVEGNDEVEAAPPGEEPLAPKVVWRTDDASPSGLAIVSGTAYLAGLRGQRLWRVPLRGDGVGKPEALLTGEYGRLRTVVAMGEGLWLTTSNTDGRGSPRRDDDRIIDVTLLPAEG